MKGYVSVLFGLYFLALFTSAVLGRGRDHDDSSNNYFKIKIKSPKDRGVDSKHYYMDMKDGFMGFGRPGAKKFEAYINGTKQGNSYLITRNDGFGFLLEDTAPKYDFRHNFVIPPTDYKAYWAVINGVLTCHQLANGFKYFPDPAGGYIIRWDTTDGVGSPLFMQVEKCGGN